MGPTDLKTNDHGRMIHYVASNQNPLTARPPTFIRLAGDQVR